MAKQLNDGNFEKLLRSAEDITETFDIDLGGMPDDVLEASRDALPFVQQARELMEQQRLLPPVNPSHIETGLIDMREWATEHGAAIMEALRSGDVAAIDGTPLVQPKRFLTQQIYACAVGRLTSRDPMQLQAKLVKVKADLHIDDDLGRVVTETEELTQSTSWPTAFMEYQERSYALQSPSNYVIVDGTLVTQNLITRMAGRQLFESMLNPTDRKVYVGVAKNISGGDADRRFVARALKTGELYVIESLKSFLGREGREEYTGAVQTFLDNVGVNVLRGVYKPGRKSFGFECHRDDLAAVVSLLWLDRNNVPGFEIPFLLAQVDAQIRGRYRPAETMAAIEATLVRAGEDEFFDETDERMYRS